MQDAVPRSAATAARNHAAPRLGRAAARPHRPRTLIKGAAAPAAMEPLFEKQAGIVRTAAMSGAQAQALSGGIRRLIVKKIYRKTMTISEIGAAVAAAEDGDKAGASIRHHVEMLRKAGAVEVVRIVQVRGTVERHYTATTRLLGHGAPDDFDEAYASEIKATARGLDKIVAKLAPRVADGSHGDGADRDYEQFAIAEIINRAMTQVLVARGGGGGGGGGG